VLDIVFQNSEFVVINKPAGMNFHTEQKKGDESAELGVVVVLKQQLGVDALYPVHRLDKMTSGLLIFALTKAVAQRFQTLFENRLIAKYYLAISTQKPKKKQGWVKGDMAEARRGSWKLMPTQTNPAVTQFVSKSSQANERWFLLKPHTGKTHQLRVALKSISAPIAGDQRYQAVQQACKENRGYLHAYALRFTLGEQTYEWTLPPTEGERFLSEAAQAVLTDWQQPWHCFKETK